MKSQNIIRLISTLLLFPLLLVSGLMDCSTDGTPLQPAKQLLYLLDNANDAVYVIEGVNTVDGPQDPERTISGDRTRLTNPTAIAVDGLRDILYVADGTERAILVFAPASTRSGNVEPLRTLPTVGNVQSMFLDVPNNRLYAFNATDQTVLVWDTVSSKNQTNPDRIFDIGFTASIIFVDTLRDFLYAGDSLNMLVAVFAQASQLIGTPLPVRIFLGDEDPFDKVDGITMNTDNDFLYLSNAIGRVIEVYPNAKDLDGMVIPDRSLEGDQTGFTSNLSFLKFLENVLYTLSSDTEVSIFNNANTVNGNASPDRVIMVNGATRLVGLDIDLLH